MTQYKNLILSKIKLDEYCFSKPANSEKLTEGSLK